MIAVQMVIVIAASFMVGMSRAPAGLEPACVPPGPDGQAVSPSIILNVSVSVVPSRTIAVTVGVSMCTM